MTDITTKIISLEVNSKSVLKIEGDPTTFLFCIPSIENCRFVQSNLDSKHYADKHISFLKRAPNASISTYIKHITQYADTFYPYEESTIKISKIIS